MKYTEGFWILRLVQGRQVERLTIQMKRWAVRHSLHLNIPQLFRLSPPASAVANVAERRAFPNHRTGQIHTPLTSKPRAICLLYQGPDLAFPCPRFWAPTPHKLSDSLLSMWPSLFIKRWTPRIPSSSGKSVGCGGHQPEYFSESPAEYLGCGRHSQMVGGRSKPESHITA